MGDSGDQSEDVAATALLVRIEQWRGALPLEAVREVVRAVAVTPLSGRPGPLLGYVDVRGDVCPVVDARRILHLRRRAVRPSDRMVILGFGRDRLIVPVDEAGRVCSVRVMEDVPPETVAPARSGEHAGLRAASIEEPGGEIVALIDPVAVFERFARGSRLAAATEVGTAPGP